MKPTRGLHVVIGAMGVALLLMAWQYVQVSRQVDANQATISQLSRTVAGGQQEAQELRRLVLALQQQVRLCRVHPKRCGPPLTVAPSPQTPTRTTAPATGPASSVQSSPAPSRSPHPTRSPSP